jgi:hypothetical protein
MEGSSHENRRIVPRSKADGRVGWRPLAVTTWWSRRKDRNAGSTASVEDISLTGARLVVPVTTTLVVGVHAQVEVDGDLGSVQVRWIEPTPESATTARVGVEFVQLSEGLTHRINSLVADGREETTDWRWLVAR